MNRLALLALLMALSSPALALSAYVPGPEKKEKKKESKLKPSAFASGGVTSGPTELRESSKGGLTGPAEVMSQTSAPTSVGGGGASGAPASAPPAGASAADAEKKSVEAVPQKKAPPKLRGR